MENIDNNENQQIKLQISFPKSNEDHRLQLVTVNDSTFAIVHSPLESLGPIHLLCESWSLVLLAPIKSKSDVLISAINVICFSEIVSEEGTVKLQATNQLVRFQHLIKSCLPVSEIGESGDFQFGDDPGALIYYYKQLNNILTSIHKGDTDSLSLAQQQLIVILSVLADKIKGGSKNLTLSKVLDVWNIPYLNN